jgi:AbrB family looped-hinge helix DNA binding protein
MSLVKIKTKGQVTLPAPLRRVVGLHVGDFLEASFEKGKITLTPKTIIDRRLAKGLADIKAGRTIGPFSTAREAIKALKTHRV